MEKAPLGYHAPDEEGHSSGRTSANLSVTLLRSRKRASVSPVLPDDDLGNTIWGQGTKLDTAIANLMTRYSISAADLYVPSAYGLVWKLCTGSRSFRAWEIY